MTVSILLRVGDTSAQDVSLTSNGAFVIDFPLNSPDTNQQALQNLGDGNSLSVPSWSNVTESFEVHVQLATAALVADKIRSIERLLDLARQGTQGLRESRLYLVLEFDQDTEAWRSQILAAQLLSAQGTDQIWKNYAVVTLIITRRYYWETEAVQAVAITSGVTTTATTGYATVYNADDTSSTNRNWFQIASDQVEGSLPAPAKLYIKNNSGTDKLVGTVYVGNYLWTGNNSVDPIFVNSGAAGGTGTFGTLETEARYWSLSTGNLTDSFRGQFGRLLAILTNTPVDTSLLRAALQIRFPVPDFDIALGEQVLSPYGDYVLDLGTIPIPPGSHWADMGSLLYLAIKGRAATATDTIAVDWVQLMPSGAGCYRAIKGIVTMSLANGEEVIDDGFEDAAYALVAGSALPIFRPLFSPIHLWPGKLQRLRLVISAGATPPEVDVAWGIKVTTRFRRLTF